MKNIMLVAVLCGALLMSCGGKVDELKKNIDQAQKVADAVEKDMPAAQEEAKKVYDERKAKGDTVAMPYKDLQGFLPSSVSGYKPDGGPSGSQQSMGGYSLSNATQNFAGEGADSSTTRMVVTVNDWGGTEGAYGMASMAFAFSMESENDQEKVNTVKPDVPMTTGICTYKKQTHEVNVVMGTRYRYLITVTVNGATDDQSQAAVAVATDVAKKLEGK